MPLGTTRRERTGTQQQPSPYAIEVADLRKRYGDLQAVDGVSFMVDHGEFFGILGPNGAGKTTTLEIIEGLRKPDGGQVSVLGMRPWPRNTRLLPRIGVQLQASAFFEKLTAIEQLETFAALYGRGRERAAEMLDLVGLADKADSPEDKLSGGQRQRLSIACSLVHDPDLVFLDEPTEGLDPQARRNLWDVLRAIQARGKTIIYTTHYIDEAELLCDRVAIMDRGKILAMDTPRTLVAGLDAPMRVIVPTTRIHADDARALHGVDEVVASEGSLALLTRRSAEVLAALSDRDALDGVQVRGSSLEDVFLDLTGREYRS